MSGKKEVTINIDNVATKFMEKVSSALKASELIMASHQYDEKTIRKIVLSTSADDLETAVADSMAFEVLEAIEAIEESRNERKSNE